MTKHNQAGNVAIIAIIVVAAVIIGGGIAYFVTDGFSQSSDESSANNSTTDKNSSGSRDKDEPALPADFPAEIPIYEPSELRKTPKPTKSSGTEIYIAGFLADGTKDEIIAFYDDALSKDGWKIESGAGVGRYNASHGDLDIVVGVARVTDEQALITITTPKSAN